MSYFKDHFFAIAAFLILLVIAVAYFSGGPKILGGADLTTIGNPHKFTDTHQVGSSGTAQAFYAEGSCNLTGGYSAAATTTTNYDCAVTGVVSGDTVVVSGPSTLPCVAGSGCITAPKGAHASTTSGFITIPIFNGLGTASSTPGTNFLNGWRYIVSR